MQALVDCHDMQLAVIAICALQFITAMQSVTLLVQSSNASSG